MRLTVLATFLVLATSAHAVDTAPPAATLDQARAEIAAENYGAAIATLQTVLASGGPDADVYNLLGYSSRKSGDLTAAAVYYDEALTLAPDHLGALEYQGELFIMTGDLPAARANLDKLTALCGTCEEQADLAQALADAGS
jgi:Flp pilus assembly protein TadD